VRHCLAPFRIKRAIRRFDTLEAMGGFRNPSSNREIMGLAFDDEPVSPGPPYGALVRDASNVPVEPGNEPPSPGVVCVRGFARQPPDPQQGTPRTK
jgi:hypothetical protein